LRRLSGSEAVVRGVGVNRVWQDGVQIPPNEILEKDIKWPSGETIAGRIVTSDGATADAEGRFVFRYSSFSGPWVLAAKPYGYREIRLLVKPGTTDVVLTMVGEGATR
jgi:hypothetical protein